MSEVPYIEQLIGVFVAGVVGGLILRALSVVGGR